jgi:hypothetical protein
VLEKTSTTVLQLLLVLSPALAQNDVVTPAAELPAGVEIIVRAQPQKATVGDPIRIDVDVSLPKGYQASVANPGNQLGEFAVLEFYPGPSLPSDASPPLPTKPAPQGAPAHYQARIIAALYKTGEFEFPSLPIVLWAADGRETTVSSKPVKIQIESVLTEKEPKLKELKKQAEIQEPVRWVLWITLALLLLIVAAAAWWLYQRRRRPAYHSPAQPQADPLVLAETDLHDLVGRGLLEKGFIKQFYVLLSEIAKRILEAGYGIKTIEKTTSEIMAELHRSPLADHGASDLRCVESLLCECDLVKFAKYVPSKTEIESAVKGCFQILESARKIRDMPPAAGEPAVAGAP